MKHKTAFFENMYKLNFSRLPNRIKHGFAESEHFQYFDVFSSCI